MYTKYFDLSSPQDMLDKAKFEFENMKTNLSAYTIFNFFVTAFHIKDYVCRHNSNYKDAIKILFKDEDFKKCEFLCNKGKHISIRSDFETNISSSRFGDTMFGELMFNEGRRYSIICGDTQVNVLDLGNCILEKWELFFKQHGLLT